MILVQSLVARAYTTQNDQTATTAMGLVFRLDTMALFISMGWGSAAQTFVGQNLGARQDARAARSGWITAAYNVATSVLLLIAVLLAGNTILHFFSDAHEPVAIGLQYLGAVAPSYIGLGIGVVLGNAMAGAGATRTTMLCDVAVILGFQFPVSILGVWLFKLEQQNLFRLVAATNYLSAFAFALVYARGKWRRNLAPSSVRPAAPAPVVDADS
jgi:Na+-driven multidrug efflux pump